MNDEAPPQQEIPFQVRLIVLVVLNKCKARPKRCFEWSVCSSATGPIYVWAFPVKQSFHCPCLYLIFQRSEKSAPCPNLQIRLLLWAKRVLFGCSDCEFHHHISETRTIYHLHFLSGAAPEGAFALQSQKISHLHLPHIDSMTDLWHATLWARSRPRGSNLPQSHAHQT